MGKVRVYELAKKLNLMNQDLIAKLTAKGITARTHSSSVDEYESLKVLGLLKGNILSIQSSRPRTVLRRRLKKTEANIVEINEDVTTISDIKNSNEIVEQVSTESVPETIELKKESNIKLANKVSKKQITDNIKKNNVVRVIDAESIKARLAQEGRVFKPKNMRNNSPKSTVLNIKEINNNVNTSNKVLDNTLSANKAPWKSSRKKTRSGFYKTNKEVVGGGYELWLSPGRKKKGDKKAENKSPIITTAAAHKRIVEIRGAVTVNELAHRMSIKAAQVVSKLMGMGMMVSVNQSIDLETASIVASEFNYEIKNISFEETDILKIEKDEIKNLIPRAPVVTVMGHVDHGKTSILDVIKKSNVAANEVGGITQHLGAYSVETSYGNITFLDTPGHEAFTLMRARGAKITDIVVLVVAADDAVMPQTIEAINHAKSANVPIIVAVNKMDSPNANSDKVLQQLAEHNVVTESWGGDVQIFKISALKKDGIEELLEGIVMLAEMQELKANPNRMGEGFVIEAKLDKGKGPVSTVLTQSGTLKQGGYLVAGEHGGRIRAMYNSNGKKLKKVGPSIPVQILGLSGVPEAGDKINIVKDEKTAKMIIEHRKEQKRDKNLVNLSKISLESFLKSTTNLKNNELRFIVKADVFGSLEALSTSLICLSTELIKINIVHKGVGSITLNDVNLAVASGATIIGFNTKADIKTQNFAINKKIDINVYKVIYEVLDNVEKSMTGLIKPNIEEKYIGKAEIRKIINLGKENIAGLYVIDGKIIRSNKLRIKRNGEIIHTCNIENLKRFKDDVKDVSAGYECGINLGNFINIKVGDILECFEIKQIEVVNIGEKLVDIKSKSTIDN